MLTGFSWVWFDLVFNFWGRQDGITQKELQLAVIFSLFLFFFLCKKKPLSSFRFCLLDDWLELLLWMKKWKKKSMHLESLIAVFLNDTFHTQAINNSWWFSYPLLKEELKAHSAGYFHFLGSSTHSGYTCKKAFWKLLIYGPTNICGGCRSRHGSGVLWLHPLCSSSEQLWMCTTNGWQQSELSYCAKACCSVYLNMCI